MHVKPSTVSRLVRFVLVSEAGSAESETEMEKLLRHLEPYKMLPGFHYLILIGPEASVLLCQFL